MIEFVNIGFLLKFVFLVMYGSSDIVYIFYRRNVDYKVIKMM